MAAVALNGSALPAHGPISAFAEEQWEDLEVVQRVRPGVFAASERVLEFGWKHWRVGAAYFPWPVHCPNARIEIPEHDSHVWLAAKGPPDSKNRSCRKLLAASAASIVQAGGAAFVWWAPNARIVSPAEFVRAALAER